MAEKGGFDSCCFKSFDWDGTPSGSESTLTNLPCYVTGDNKDVAVLYVHDALGWKFRNARLLADHFAREANVTVYMPDFFDGEQLDAKAVLEGRWQDLDMAGFAQRNSRENREPSIFGCAKALKSEYGYKKLGCTGYCFGGWAVLRLGAGPHPLVDAAVCAHPTWATKEDLSGIEVPVQFQAPEHDTMFTDEMKLHAFQSLVLGKKSVPVEYIHFPKIAHGCFTKGDENSPGEREGMIKAKDLAVGFFKQYLKA